MKATVYELLICHECHDRIKGDMPHTLWENKLYCDDCYHDYLNNLELLGWKLEDDK